ncbi:MAG TPA: DsbE family thiol:disulfide interchange protein [Rhizomicrobium sp.]|nr:DsbE family thiol:disulfide interchange protein [Rhizomicrobium sp.]
MKRLLYIVPVLAFLGLALLLFANLHHGESDELPSTLIGHAIPPTTLPPLDAQARGFGPSDLAAKGRVTVVNVFASWCVPCREEAPQLAQLARIRGVRMIGLVYKDKPEAARAFLSEYGNPFERIGLDAEGRAAIDWGISKVPETYVIDGRGIVRGRFGPLTPDSLVLDVLPAIAIAARD